MTAAEIQVQITAIDAKIAQIITDGVVAGKLGDFDPKQPQQLAALRETRAMYVQLLEDEDPISFTRTSVDMSDA